ncbi:NADH-quinone oxidoreductase subunit NuoN [Brevundimonas sp. 2R-24]|uniref:NADH-quinone oxidoreductase subunit N n=1 Tax=Peiella sedimenti TaxID=3061083 RepID=A0ABT8SM65_9CAUL|nr:NADH-quinone oxidoreductase subunit NuoN [Caulobacteraceae bacterium XZ-24]
MDLNAILMLLRPELTLAIGAMFALMLGAFAGERAAGWVSLICAVVLGLAAVFAATGPLGAAFGGAFTADRLSVFAKVVLFLAAMAAVSLGHGWQHRGGRPRFEYPVLIVLSTLGMSIMVSAGDLISLYMGLELSSLALYVLAAFNRDDAKASEAGLKYFVLGALSSGILLYGASLLYGFAGSMRFVDLAVAVQGGADPAVLFGLVFVIAGMIFKVSAAPFHMWTPDVYEGAPTPSVAFFASASKMAALVLIARVLLGPFADAAEQWRQVVVLVAMLSFAVGALGGLRQRNIKRLLAYSSIANMGYALLAVAAGGTIGLKAVLVFTTLYVIDSIGFFACLLALSRRGNPIETIDDLAGLWKVKPGFAIALTILSLSVLGMPPLAGFWAKVFVFGAAVTSGLWVFAAIGLVASVIAAFYYLRIVKVMWFDAPVGEADRSPRDARWLAMACAAFSFPLVLLALGLLDGRAAWAAQSLGLG